MFVIKRQNKNDSGSAFWNEEEGTWLSEPSQASQFLWSWAWELAGRLKAENPEYDLTVERFGS